jgi:hypothetical protein
MISCAVLPIAFGIPFPFGIPCFSIPLELALASGELSPFSIPFGVVFTELFEVVFRVVSCGLSGGPTPIEPSHGRR